MQKYQQSVYLLVKIFCMQKMQKINKPIISVSLRFILWVYQLCNVFNVYC